MKTSKSEIFGSQEVGVQDVGKGDRHILDTSIMVMDWEDSETKALTNKSSMPSSDVDVLSILISLVKV